MARHLFLVHTNPVPGRDEEYNDWYDSVHLREVLDVPGFVAAQRFAVSATLPGDPQPPQQYLSIYEIETDDVDAALGDLRRAAKAMDISSALDRSTVTAFAVTPISARRTVDDGA